MLHYHLVEKIGEGGMGEVYLAEDLKLKRRIALKVLPEGMSLDVERLGRFQREAEAVAALNHPNIVQIYSIESAGNLNFLIMELVEGNTLDDLTPQCGLTLDLFLEVAVPLADALAAAHAKGITHRDLKPANIMVADDGRRVKILDFGLAKLQQGNEGFGEGTERSTLGMTREGAVLGTIPYMSPEQLEGKAVDHRTDIFSLGIVLYEMAVGKRPFVGDNNARIATEILTLSPVPVTDVRDGLPRNLGRIIARCLAKDPRERYQTAAEIYREMKRLQRGLAQGAPTSKRADLPLQATPFIGRRRELVVLTELLRRDDVRLVTLTGPGGIGKTRLSLQVAADVLSSFEHGVFFIELAPITDSELVITTIASTLGVSEAGGEPLIDTLTRSLGNNRLLLVIDNFEHVIDAAAVVGELINGAPNIKILSSSRELLRVYGEHDFLVQPMAVPEVGRPQTVAEVSQCDAVSLFTQRARAAQADFEMTEHNAAAIADICTRLDGLPLAIELAAARVRLFDPETLLERLSDSLKTLTGGARDLPRRQQTIRNTIEWSYDLLDDEEQVLFARLAVFQGGRSIKAVEAVCGPGQGIDVLDGLESLLNKSLVQRERGPEGETRFRMLETIHAFVSERLDESEEVEELRKRHAAYFAVMAEQASGELTGHEQGVWLNRLTLDYENLRKAMDWALGGGDVQIGLRIAAALGGYWRHKSRLQEGQRWLQLGLDLADQAPETVQGQLYAWAGFMAFSHHNSAECKRLYEKALVVERKLNNQSKVANILINLGFVSGELSEINVESTEEGLALAREIGDKNGVAFGLNILGEIYRMQGDYPAAKQVYEESLPIAREIGDQMRETMIMGNLGIVAFNLGDFEQARARDLEAYKLALEIGNDYLIRGALSFSGGYLGGLGQPERAIRLMSAGDTQLAAIGSRRQAADQHEIEKLLALVRNQVDDETFDRLWTEGESMTLEDAIDLVLRED